MTGDERLALICCYVQAVLEHDEEDMRVHIRDELQYDPALTHDGGTEPDPAVLDEAVEAKLYDISCMEIDYDPGVGFDYGHRFAMSDLQHFIGLLDTDPAEARRILDIKQGITPAA